MVELAIDHDHILQPEAEVARHVAVAALPAIPPFDVVLIPVHAHVHLVPDHALKNMTGNDYQEKLNKKSEKLCYLDNTVLKDWIQFWKDWRKGVFGIVSMVHTIFSVILR